MKTVEFVLGRGRRVKENDEGDKSKIYRKHTCKDQNASLCTIIIN
jgi:hypothetical protein